MPCLLSATYRLEKLCTRIIVENQEGDGTRVTLKAESDFSLISRAKAKVVASATVGRLIVGFIPETACRVGVRPSAVTDRSVTRSLTGQSINGQASKISDRSLTSQSKLADILIGIDD